MRPFEKEVINVDRVPVDGNASSEPRTQQIRVLKFGGSSVGTPASIRQVVQVVLAASRSRRIIVVVSALADVTDLLEEIVDLRSGETVSHLLVLYRRHLQTAKELLSGKYLAAYRSVLSREFAFVVPSIRRIRERVSSRFDPENVLAAGERFSAPLIAAALAEAGLASTHVDASRLIRVSEPGLREVDQHITRDHIQRWFSRLPINEIPVVTGYIGSAECGNTVTLGRGGSDLTAALLAASLSAEVLERWTDVDGLYTADPESDPTARKYDILPMDDAVSLNRAEKLGMHKHTLEPLISSHTPMHVKSFTRPGSGTLIIPNSSGA